MGLKYNSFDITKVTYNGQPVNKIYYNGTLAYSAKSYTHTIKLTTNPIWTSGYCDCEFSINTYNEEPITSWDVLVDILQQKLAESESHTYLIPLRGQFYESFIYQYNNETTELTPYGQIKYWYTISYDSPDHISRSVNPVEALGAPPILTDTVTETP